MHTQLYRRQSRASDLAIGAVAGAIVGAGVALLYAPKPGKRLRRDLSLSANDLRDRAGTAVRSTGRKVVGTANAVSDKAQDVIASVGETVRAARGHR